MLMKAKCEVVWLGFFFFFSVSEIIVHSQTLTKTTVRLHLTDLSERAPGLLPCEALVNTKQSGFLRRSFMLGQCVPKPIIFLISLFV